MKTCKGNIILSASNAILKLLTVDAAATAVRRGVKCRDGRADILEKLRKEREVEPRYGAILMGKEDTYAHMVLQRFVLGCDVPEKKRKKSNSGRYEFASSV